jgi:hypothetical protein
MIFPIVIPIFIPISSSSEEIPMWLGISIITFALSPTLYIVYKLIRRLIH